MCHISCDQTYVLLMCIICESCVIVQQVEHEFKNISTHACIHIHMCNICTFFILYTYINIHVLWGFLICISYVIITHDKHV